MSNDELIPLDSALFDTRSPKEQKKDYLIDELAGVPNLVPFRHKKLSTLSATVYSQEFTSSCVPHAILTQLEYEKVMKPKPHGYSQLMLYRKRINYSGPGSIVADIYKGLLDGAMPHSSSPVKTGHTEKEANQLPFLIGEPLNKTFTYYRINDYNKVPDEVSHGKAVVLLIYATKNEWRKEYVTPTDSIPNPWAAEVRHAVCLVPDGDFKENGIEWLTVHDSAKFGGRHLRYISKDFLLKRSFYASIVYRDDKLPAPEPPVTNLPTEPCRIGDRGRAVKNLQGYLIQQGYLASIYQTGYFGNLTAKALLEWQLKYNQHFNYLNPVRDLMALKGHYFGEQSIELVKELNK